MNAKEARENTFKFRHVPYDEKLQTKVTKSPCVMSYKCLRKHFLFLIERAIERGEFQIETYVDTSIEKIHSDMLSNISFNFMEMGFDVCIKRSYLSEIIDFIFTLKYNKVFKVIIDW
jgi:hypothetical protein